MSPGRNVIGSPMEDGRIFSMFTNDRLRTVRCPQWFRSVVKCGGEGQSGQAIKLFQAPRKLVYLPFLTQVFHPWWCETCRFIQQQFWMKECDILWVKTYSDPSYIFSGGQNPSTPRIYATECPCSRGELLIHQKGTRQSANLCRSSSSPWAS